MVIFHCYVSSPEGNTTSNGRASVDPGDPGDPGCSAEVCHRHVLRGSAERSDAALHQIHAGRREVGQQCRSADGDDEIRQQTYDSNLAWNRNLESRRKIDVVITPVGDITIYCMHIYIYRYHMSLQIDANSICLQGKIEFIEIWWDM